VERLAGITAFAHFYRNPPLLLFFAPEKIRANLIQKLNGCEQVDAQTHNGVGNAQTRILSAILACLCNRQILGLGFSAKYYCNDGRLDKSWSSSEKILIIVAFQPVFSEVVIVFIQ
jgi:hypothetical protein